MSQWSHTLKMILKRLLIGDTVEDFAHSLARSPGRQISCSGCAGLERTQHFEQSLLCERMVVLKRLIFVIFQFGRLWCS